MKLHANAALTVAQRREIKRLFDEEQIAVPELAQRFCVHPTTIRRWINRDTPEDRSSLPQRLRTVVTPEYEQAVVAYRQAHPTHGPIRIAEELRPQFALAHRGTVLGILQKHQLTRPKNAVRQRWQIPVGRHRLQMDVQQLPAIQGQRGFEYKISLIHLATRWKYSEIHPECRSETLAQVYRRALDELPPFLLPSPITP